MKRRATAGGEPVQHKMYVTALDHSQYLRQLRKTEGGLSDMNTPQAGDLMENLA